MTSAWRHLANATHIDRILASVKSHPDIWSVPGDVSRAMAWNAGRAASQSTGRDEAWFSALSAARPPTLRVVANGAGGAILALVAWDNSAKFFDMTADELEFWAVLSKDSAAILILPAVRAFEQIEPLELT